jgi:hypothetical protein
VVGAALCVAALGVAAPAAAAEEHQEWGISVIEPAPGAPVQAMMPLEVPAQPLVFEFRAPPPGERPLAHIVVWSRNPTEPGNLFPEQAQVDYFNVAQSPVDPTVFRGETLNRSWRSQPGTYYWQAEGVYWTGAPTYSRVNLASPLFTINVVAASGESGAGSQKSLEERAEWCGYYAGRVVYITRHIRPAERALRQARSARDKKRLRGKLRRLRHERSKAETEERRLCH